ncbi:MAG: ABC transporter ATP-binding protein [Patescibacteria group bacterium]
MRKAISVKHLKKSFKNTEIFSDFNVDIEEGKITAIFGPNGSGKSTLLNLLSGVLIKDGGNMYISNSNRFDLSYIFQNYRESLLPWRTNYENIALPLQIQHKTKEEIEERIKVLESIFEFKFNRTGYSYELSGGQQQILAFMRALITEPKVLLIDEPFSALDYENNLLLRNHLQRYFLRFKPTILLITHNIEEAVHLADTVLIFSKKPTIVTEKIHNPIAYPRTVQSVTSAEAHALKNKILESFQKTINI